MGNLELAFDSVVGLNRIRLIELVEQSCSRIWTTGGVTLRISHGLVDNCIILKANRLVRHCDLSSCNLNCRFLFGRMEKKN